MHLHVPVLSISKGGKFTVRKSVEYFNSVYCFLRNTTLDDRNMVCLHVCAS